MREQQNDGEKLKRVNALYRKLKEEWNKERWEEKAKEEREALIQRIRRSIENHIGEINNDIEQYVAWKLENKVEIYEVVHEYDPPYDSSGILCSTKEKIDKNSKKTFHEFLENYVGDSIATYISGMGISYPTFQEHICEKIQSILGNIQWETIEEMFNAGKIDFFYCQQLYGRKEELKTKEDIEDILGEVADEVDWEFFVEEDIFYRLPIYIENKRLCEIYKKQEFYMKRFKKNLQKYNEEYEKMLRDLKNEVKGLPFLFESNKKIEKKDEELIQKLKEIYSKRQLGILVYFGYIICSNSLKWELSKEIEKEIESKRKSLREQYHFLENS